jgi:hypothetical protein
VIPPRRFPNPLGQVGSPVDYGKTTGNQEKNPKNSLDLFRDPSGIGKKYDEM